MERRSRITQISCRLLFCEHDDEPSAFLKYCGFHDQLNNCKVLKGARAVKVNLGSQKSARQNGAVRVLLESANVKAFVQTEAICLPFDGTDSTMKRTSCFNCPRRFQRQ